MCKATIHWAWSCRRQPPLLKSQKIPPEIHLLATDIMIETVKWMFCCCSDSRDHLIKPGCFPHWFLWLQYSITGSVSNPATMCVQPLQRDKRGTIYTKIEFRWRDRSYNRHFQANCGHKSWSLQLDHKHRFNTVYFLLSSIAAFPFMPLISPPRAQTHTFNLIPFRTVTNTHATSISRENDDSSGVVVRRRGSSWSGCWSRACLLVHTCTHTRARTHTHTHTHTYTLSFRTLQSTSEGGDVILSAAAEASEGGGERERERNVRSKG